MRTDVDVSGTAAAGSATLATLAAGQFLMTLDSSVMNVSIATVAEDVGTDVTGIQTAITLYTLVMAVLMITGGKVGQILGRKRAFAVGRVIYGAGSLITSLAPSLTVLIVGWSLLEGIGAADSVTVDAHKWLSAPMGAGVLLTPHAAALRQAFAVDAGYMPSGDAVDPYLSGLQWSRRCTGLKVFLALAATGREGVAAQIDRDVALGDRLRAGLRDDGWRSVLAVPMLRGPVIVGVLVIRRRSVGTFADDVVELLEKMDLGLDPISDAMAWATENEIQDEWDRVAVYYLETYEDRWTAWMPEDKVQMVKDAMTQETE